MPAPSAWENILNLSSLPYDDDEEEGFVTLPVPTNISQKNLIFMLVKLLRYKNNATDTNIRYMIEAYNLNDEKYNKRLETMLGWSKYFYHDSYLHVNKALSVSKSNLEIYPHIVPSLEMHLLSEKEFAETYSAWVDLINGMKIKFTEKQRGIVIPGEMPTGITANMIDTIIKNKTNSFKEMCRLNKFNADGIGYIRIDTDNIQDVLSASLGREDRFKLITAWQARCYITSLPEGIELLSDKELKAIVVNCIPFETTDDWMFYENFVSKFGIDKKPSKKLGNQSNYGARKVFANKSGVNVSRAEQIKSRINSVPDADKKSTKEAEKHILRHEFGFDALPYDALATEYPNLSEYQRALVIYGESPYSFAPKDLLTREEKTKWLKTKLNAIEVIWLLGKPSFVAGLGINNLFPASSVLTRWLVYALQQKDTANAIFKTRTRPIAGELNTYRYIDMLHLAEESDLNKTMPERTSVGKIFDLIFDRVKAQTEERLLNNNRIISVAPPWFVPTDGVSQITTSRELVLEGNVVRHCSATYIRHIEVGNMFFFSLSTPSGRSTAKFDSKGLLLEHKGFRNNIPQQENIMLLLRMIDDCCLNGVNQNNPSMKTEHGLDP